MTRTCFTLAPLRSDTALAKRRAVPRADVAVLWPVAETMVVASAEPLLDALEADDGGHAFVALAARNVRPWWPVFPSPG